MSTVYNKNDNFDFQIEWIFQIIVHIINFQDRGGTYLTCFSKLLQAKLMFKRVKYIVFLFSMTCPLIDIHIDVFFFQPSSLFTPLGIDLVKNFCYNFPIFGMFLKYAKFHKDRFLTVPLPCVRMPGQR